jgi:predicted TIM-barrel fold metal-dependent hydrolase
MFILDSIVQPPIDGNQAVYEPGAILSNTISTNGIRVKRGFPPLDAGFTLERFMSEMGDAGVGHAVIGGRSTDAAVTDLLSKFPSKFSALAMWNPFTCGDVQKFIADVKRAGMKGVIVGSAPPKNIYVDDRLNYPLYEAAIAADMVCYMGTGGSAGPDQSYSASLPVDRVAGDFPKLVMVVVHAGFPHAQEYCGVLYRRSNVCLLLDHYFPGLPGEADYLLAASGYAQDRMLYASGFPYSPFKDQIARFLRLPLQDSIKEKILGLNGARIFGVSTT